MCGRFVLDTTEKKINEQLHAALINPIPNSFNVAPTEPCLVVTQNEEQRLAQVMNWGIHPWYNPKQLLINARIETVREKSAFKQAFKKRRCLLLINGFFEWQHHQVDSKTVKQPYFIQQQDQQLMAIAAIWESGNADNSSLTCCLLTTAANSAVEPLHDRMPLIISPAYYDLWLDSSEVGFKDELLKAIRDETLKIPLKNYAVTTKVNKNNYKAANTIQAI